jgi:hypothetical protein
MILKINYKTNTPKIVTLSSDTLDGVYWNVVYDAKAFYDRYYASSESGGAIAPSDSVRHIHEDIIDTYLNTVAGVPYTKEDLLHNTKLNIINPTVHIKL